MVLALPPENLAELQKLCGTYNVELTDIGVFTGSGRLVVRYDKKVVLDLANTFLHDGIPQRQLIAKIGKRYERLEKSGSNYAAYINASDLSEILLKLLAHPNIASKASVIRLYDHEVQGGTVIKPLTGAQEDGPSDASVLKPLGVKGRAGIAIASGINAEYGKRDAYHMAMAVLDEAVRNVVAVGADPGRIAILDNFCWGDPLRSETLGSLVEACRGCQEAALLFRTPFISGKDSLNNEYLGTDGQRHAIPPTLLISSIGVMPDVLDAVTMDLKAAGNYFYLMGYFWPVFGGSHFDLVNGLVASEPIPEVHTSTPGLYQSLYRAISDKLICSCHDLSEGGLAVAAAEMCIGGRLGLLLDLPEGEPARVLFGETNGCLLVEVEPEKAAAFDSALAGQPVRKVGLVTAEAVLQVNSQGRTLFDLPIAELVSAWTAPLQPV
jgi:phosphoribosylformylglycinamidine synthase